LKSPAHSNLGQGVSLPGRALTVNRWGLWKPPCRPRKATAGANTLRIEITNLGSNRMIDDERMHSSAARFEKIEKSPAMLAYASLVEWPEWFLEKQPRSTGRNAFSTGQHRNTKDELLLSGLNGP
jgi:hypothetical protein